MKKTTMMSLAAAMFLGASSAALAQDTRPEAKVTLFYSGAETVLKAEAMTFSPKFDINGDYFSVVFEAPLKYRRFGVAGSWLQGRSEDLPGAKDFITSGYDFAYYATFNPLTDEKIKRLSLGLTITALDYRDHTGNLDVTLGYFLLESQPGISKGNTFGGFSIGVAGGYDWRFRNHDISITGMTSFVPTFFVHGNVEGQFTQDYIVEYRTGLEYMIAKHLGLTVGYQGMYLKGRVTDETMGTAQSVLGRAVSDEAIVANHGLYVGGLVKLGRR